MKKYILVLCCCAAVVALRAQQVEGYAFPVKGVAGLYSASYGEMRPDHFHSGVDIKTDGVTGKQVVAAADGYVSRIVVSSSGYGRALYLTHPDGRTTVYGHLLSFRADIEEYARAQRYDKGENRIDVWCTSKQFPVRKGETIALSGNTGGSMGPHLHFEIRDTPTQRTLNPVKECALPVKDDIAPQILALYAVATDTLSGIPVHSEPQRIALKASASGYRADTVEVAPRAYFIAEVLDRRNDCNNRFGVCRITMSVDGEPYAEYRMEGFAFDRTRWCNAVSYYPMQRRARSEVVRLARVGDTPDGFYPVMTDRGLLSVPKGEIRNLRFEVEDDCGNTSVAEVAVRGGEQPEFALAEGEKIDRRRKFTAQCGAMSLEIPSDALYESTVFSSSCESYSEPDPKVPVLSPVYSFLDPSVPLHKAAKLRIRAFVPQVMQSAAALASVGDKGALSYAGGKYSDGCLEASVRRAGRYCVVVDTVAPAIAPSFAAGADMSRSKALRFKVSDNFSGIASFDVYIDGRWVPAEYSPTNRIVTAWFADMRDMSSGRHSATLVAHDGCGNRSECEAVFIR